VAVELYDRGVCVGDVIARGKVETFHRKKSRDLRRKGDVTMEARPSRVKLEASPLTAYF
jgi:hypothetical protein